MSLLFLQHCDTLRHFSTLFDTFRRFATLCDALRRFATRNRKCKCRFITLLFWLQKGANLIIIRLLLQTRLFTNRKKGSIKRRIIFKVIIIVEWHNTLFCLKWAKRRNSCLSFSSDLQNSIVGDLNEGKERGKWMNAGSQ